MELLLIDQNLEVYDILDTFESLIWTDRYSSYGDFEIYTLVNPEMLLKLRLDSYVGLNDSDHSMFIENIEINTDSEEGPRLTFTGRSLESMLERRIVWRRTVLNGDFQNGVKKLLDENVISPVDKKRKIDNFIFEFSTDPVITALKIDTQFTGDNLYDAIKKLCDSKHIGFKVTINGDKFVFKLYSGVDRSYDQLINPYVVFSPKFENILNSNYLESNKILKNITLVAGEGEGLDRKTVVVSNDHDATGLNRRETYTDARDISTRDADGELISDEDYNKQLSQRGLETLAENISIQTFDGQVDAQYMFRYGEDFFIGDVVQIVNEYGIESKSRVTELIRSQNNSGMSVYPTFTTV